MTNTLRALRAFQERAFQEHIVLLDQKQSWVH